MHHVESGEVEPEESLGSIGAGNLSPAAGSDSQNASPMARDSGNRSGAKTAIPLNDVDIDGLLHNEFDDLARSEKAKSKDEMDFVDMNSPLSEGDKEGFGASENGDSYSI